VPGNARAVLLLAKVVEWRDDSVARVATMERPLSRGTAVFPDPLPPTPDPSVRAKPALWSCHLAEVLSSASVLRLKRLNFRASIECQCRGRPRISLRGLSAMPGAPEGFAGGQHGIPGCVGNSPGSGHAGALRARRPGWCVSRTLLRSPRAPVASGRES
jgi:hypothetical protein